MNLLCGSNILDQNNDTLNQYDEGQRAHTIKFMSNQIENHTDLNKINNNNKNINNLKLEIPKNSVNSNINKELLIKNQSLKDSIKCSNNASELEIIEYPVDEDKKSDFKNINDILISQAKDYINDKTQNDLIDYLKGKDGLNYLNLLLENYNDKDSDNSHKEHNDNDINNESSESDEIICSYIEIDRNNNSVLNRMSKEKSVIKKSSFSKMHQSSYSDCSLMPKNYDNNTANNLSKIAHTIESKFKNNEEEKKINAGKENKNKNTDMKFKKKLNHTLTPHYNTLTSKNKKTKKEEREEKEKETETEREKNKDADKTTLATEEKNNQRSPYINKSNKKKNIPINKNKLESFRTIESLNNIININPISKGKKYIKKDKKSLGKSKMIQFERCKPKNCTIDKNINSIDKNYSQVSQIYKSIKGSSTNNKKRHIYHKEKMAMTMNNNMLFNSINVKGNKKFNKGNFLSLKKSLLNPMRVDSKNKTINEKANESNSKLKLRKLLINNNPNQKNYKHKCDLSMYNINCLSNNCTLAMKKGKNKTLSKIMNKSEANKQFNNTIKVRSNNNNNNNNDFRPNKNLYIHTSISKILK